MVLYCSLIRARKRTTQLEKEQYVNIETISIILAIASGVCTTVAYVDYIQMTIRGTNDPNKTTWIIWALISLISTSSYFAASADLWKNIITLVNMFLCIGTLVILLLRNGKIRTRLTAKECLSLVIGISTIIIWKLTSPAYANLVVQAAIAIGFVPTWESIWEDPSRERSRPWWIWSTAYALALAVVILRWKHQWTDLVYPINCIILHPSVPLLATARRRFGSKPRKVRSAFTTI